MNYSTKDYEFLGKQVATGHYVARSTFFLSLALMLLIGICVGRYVFPDAGTLGGSAMRNEEKRPIGQGSSIASAVNPNKQLYDSILQHEEQVRQDPTNIEAWEHLGNLYFDVNEPQKSVNAYNKALEINPKNSNVLVDCGVMYRALKQFDKALEYFQKALDIDAKHEFALFNSGIVLYHDLNRKPEALEQWRKLVKVKPDAKAPNGQLVSEMIKDHEIR